MDRTVSSQLTGVGVASRGNRQHGMENFRERFATQRMGGTQPPTRIGLQAIARQSIDFPEGATEADNLDTFMTCISLLNASPSTDTGSLLGYYGAAIGCFFPDMKDIILDVLASNGYNSNRFKLPTDAGGMLIDMVTGASYNKCLILMGQLCLIPYKNISEANYESFIAKRITALKAHVGILPEETQLKAVNRMEAAVGIKSTFGSNPIFKRCLLERIIEQASRENSVGVMCSYVAQILSWTDMSAMTFILDMLLSVKSPVLFDPRVASEVKNLAIAFKAVNRFNFPQYFRILAPANDQKKLERSKFPILSAVAQKLRSADYQSVAQFISALPVDNDVVTSLVNLHNQHTQRTEGRAVISAIEYLTTDTAEADVD